VRSSARRAGRSVAGVEAGKLTLPIYKTYKLATSPMRSSHARHQHSARSSSTSLERVRRRELRPSLSIGAVVEITGANPLYTLAP